MNRRDFLRNMLYGAAAATLPLPALADEPVLLRGEVGRWNGIKFGDGWTHVVGVFHADGTRTLYIDGCRMAETLAQQATPLRIQTTGHSYPYWLEYMAREDGENIQVAYAAIYDDHGKETMRWRPMG